MYSSLYQGSLRVVFICYICVSQVSLYLFASQQLKTLCEVVEYSIGIAANLPDPYFYCK